MSSLTDSHGKLNDVGDDHQMLRVKKRGLRGYEDVHFDKITTRIMALTAGLSPEVNATLIAQLTIKNLYNGISTEELDYISASQADSMSLICPDYSRLASRILVSNLHKTTPDKFSACMRELNGQLSTFDPAVIDWIMAHADELDAMINHQADYDFDYFGYKTLERSYLQKCSRPSLDELGRQIYLDRGGKPVPHDRIIMTKRGIACVKVDNEIIALKAQKYNQIVDRPQYVYMRVAICEWYQTPDPMPAIKRAYEDMSAHLYTHATPTLFNACAKRQQLGSCFLLGTGDSLDDIMDTLKDCSTISKEAGGIGVWYHGIRSCGSLIKGTNGPSSGILRQLKMFNDAAVCWDQGSKRKGAFAIYLEPWHGDIMTFLKMKLNTGTDDERARDLFYALWVPDLFVHRAHSGRMWSLFSADTAPGLCDVYDGMIVCAECGYCANPNYKKWVGTGEIEDVPVVTDTPCDDAHHTMTYVNAFTRLYEEYESGGLAVGTISAQSVVNAIIEMQRESGTPYICFKDHVNRMSNQQNIDTVRSSNLCTEIMEVSTPDDYATCTLASINLPKFVKSVTVDGVTTYTFDHAHLHDTVRSVVRNLDRVIDVGRYPTEKCIKFAHGQRPIAVGIQGLADTFAIMRLTFTSEAAARLDFEIAETIYHAATTESAHRARTHGSYDGFVGSPVSRGILQPDFWRANNVHMGNKLADTPIPYSGRYDFEALRKLARGGMRNSLLCANMPTVATSQILGNNESFEPFNSNVYTKNTIAGKFTVVNRHMVSHLTELGLWTESTRLHLGRSGSIADLTAIPKAVRDIYSTVWEINQTDLMRRAAIRGAFIDQAQSLNIHVRSNTNMTLRGVFFMGHSLGLKTGSYYVRSSLKVEAMKNNIARKVADEAPRDAGGFIIPCVDSCSS